LRKNQGKKVTPKLRNSREVMCWRQKEPLYREGGARRMPSPGRDDPRRDQISGQLERGLRRNQKVPHYNHTPEGLSRTVTSRQRSLGSRGGGGNGSYATRFLKTAPKKGGQEGSRSWEIVRRRKSQPSRKKKLRGWKKRAVSGRPHLRGAEQGKGGGGKVRGDARKRFLIDGEGPENKKAPLPKVEVLTDQRGQDLREKPGGEQTVLLRGVLLSERETSHEQLSDREGPDHKKGGLHCCEGEPWKSRPRREVSYQGGCAWGHGHRQEVQQFKGKGARFGGKKRKRGAFGGKAKKRPGKQEFLQREREDE